MEARVGTDAARRVPSCAAGNRHEGACICAVFARGSRECWVSRITAEDELPVVAARPADVPGTLGPGWLCGV